MLLVSKHKILKMIDEEINISKSYVSKYQEKIDDPGCDEKNKKYFNTLTEHYHERFITLLALKLRIKKEL